MAEPLHPVDGGEGQLGHHTTVEDGVEHRQQGGEGEAWDKSSFIT